ncbi:MAG: cation transporter [Acidimicrobiia bacterium]
MVPEDAVAEDGGPTLVLGQHDHLLRRGLRLEYATLVWNVVGSAVLVAAAIATGSVALAGFGLDSMIEIFASIVVVWHLRNIATSRERTALGLIRLAFVGLAVYLSIQSVYALATHAEPRTSPIGIAWVSATFIAMLILAVGKARTGAALGNAVLSSEARVTLVDAVLAGAVLAGLVADAVLGWWWADALAGLVIVAYAVKEARTLAGERGDRS